MIWRPDTPGPRFLPSGFSGRMRISRCRLWSRRDAAATRTRKLVLVTGVPGSGKTLVGLRLVHDPELDQLAVARGGGSGKPTCPAVFLSGNGPLVEVLQHALREAGGGGKTFVRGVKDYVKTYSRKASLVPPEHVLIFDEAQRAFDAEKLGEVHKKDGMAAGKTEPEWFIHFAERVPEWCVVIGLIGSGQEIHVGEEGGIVQWRHAIERSANPDAWTVHAPAELERHFTGLATCAAQGLELDLAVLAWGTDFIRKDGMWSDALARKYQKSSTVRDPLNLRRNAYRVLLTRGRDGTVVFVPPEPILDETYEHLKECGCREM
jgi:hypothetical protein